MDLKKAVLGFYYDMTINELQLMNSDTSFPNITYNSLLYLDIITYEGKCTVTRLADALRISKPAVTAKVNEMVKQGLLTREQSSEDKRVFYLTVSREAAKEYEIYNRALHNAVTQVQGNFTQDEINIFCEILQVIKKEYQKEVRNE